MKNQYNNYISGIQTQIIEKERHDFLSSAIPLITELKSVAEKNQDNLKIFKGVNAELSKSVEMSIDDIKQLNNLLSISKNGLSKLPVLKSKITELEFHPTSSDPAFNSKVNNLISGAYNHMTISKIGSTEKSMQSMIAEMEQFEIDKKLAEEEKKKRTIKYVLIGIGSLIGLYLIVAFVIPFIIEWWWAILIAAIGIGWLISKAD